MKSSFELTENYLSRSPKKLFVYNKTQKFWYRTYFMFWLAALALIILNIVETNLLFLVICLYICTPTILYGIKKIHQYNLEIALDKYPEIAKYHTKYSYRLYLEIKDYLTKNDIGPLSTKARKEKMPILIEGTKQARDNAKMDHGKYRASLLFVGISMLLGCIITSTINSNPAYFLIAYLLFCLIFLAAFAWYLIEDKKNEKYRALNEFVGTLYRIQL